VFTTAKCGDFRSRKSDSISIRQGAHWV